MDSPRKPLFEAGFSILIAACVILLAPLQSLGQDKQATVLPEDLISSPQRWWARAILFKDRLTTDATSRPVRIDDKRYAPFSTRVVGTCYATEEVTPIINSLALNRDYAFSGTVFQHRGRYYIIVDGVNAVVDTSDMVREMRELAPDLEPSVTEDALKPIAEIVWEVESAHMAYAQEKNIPLCELYDPQSIHFPKAMELVRGAIMNKEMKDRTVSSELLAQYLVLALARSCGVTGKVEQAAEPDDEPAAAPEAEEPATPTSPPAPPVIVEPPAAAPPTPAAADVEEDVEEASNMDEAVPRSQPVIEPAETPESEVAPAEESPSFLQRWRNRREEKRRENEARDAERAREAERARVVEQAERERLAAEKARQEEAAEQTRLAAERERERLAAEQEKRERLEKEAYEAEKRAMAEERQRAKAEKARLKQEEAERRAAEKTVFDRIEQERKEARRKDMEQLARDAEQRKALEQAARAQQLEAERAQQKAAEEAERRKREADTPVPATLSTGDLEATPSQPGWWQRFLERRRVAAAERQERNRIAREEAEKRQQAWDQYFREEEERVNAERAARKAEKERLAEEKRLAKEKESQRLAAEREEKERLKQQAAEARERAKREQEQAAREREDAMRRAEEQRIAQQDVAPTPQAPQVSDAPVVDVAATAPDAESVTEEPPPIPLDPREVERLRMDEEKKYREFRDQQQRDADRVERQRKAMEREIERQMRRSSP